MTNGSSEETPATVPERAKRAGEAQGRWSWVEPSVWTERMLAAFDNINLLLVPVAGQIHCQVTPLTPVQKRILELWALPTTLYTRFSA